MKHKTICVASLIGGMIVGSALALLFAPQSGNELRGKIKDMIDDGVDRMMAKAEEAKLKIKSEVDALDQKLEQKSAQKS